MSASEWYLIPDLSEFANKTRLIVYNNFGDWKNFNEDSILDDNIETYEKEELDKILSLDESLSIIKEHIKKQKNKYSNEIEYSLSDSMFASIVSKLNERMISNIIRGLVDKGLIEMAFDNDANDFVFWVKNNDTDKKEKS